MNPAYADDVKDTNKQLAKISKIVATIEAKLDKNQKNHEVVQKEMANLEREIGVLHQQIDHTKQQIQAKQSTLDKLGKQEIALEKKISTHSEIFKKQIRLAYVSGSQSKWKALLSQNSLQDVGRNAVIYDLVHQSRSQQISEMKVLIDQARESKQRSEIEQISLQKLLNKHTNAQSSLEKVRIEKQAIQKQLEITIASNSDELKREKTKQNKLRKLLKNIAVKQAKGKFSQNKRKLRWPTEGSFKRKFGDKRLNSSENRWNGALIRATKGSEVKAIYPGTVVFSDWFDHYGWLIILDHGDEYMSLYAHSEGLYKSVGEEVTQGELIALVGDSGDISQSGLYFEIRRQGTPVDPASWCVTPKMAYSP